MLSGCSSQISGIMFSFDNDFLFFRYHLFTIPISSRINAPLPAKSEMDESMVNGLTAPMGNIQAPTGSFCQVHGRECFGHSPDLIEFDQHRVHDHLFNSTFNKFRRGNKNVVNDQFNLLSQSLCQELSDLPVFFGQPFLDRDNGILLYKHFVIRCHFFGA